jgi:hypothetical protein
VRTSSLETGAGERWRNSAGGTWGIQPLLRSSGLEECTDEPLRWQTKYRSALAATHPDMAKILQPGLNSGTSPAASASMIARSRIAAVHGLLHVRS